MSLHYPPDLYRGTTGETTARMRPGDAGADVRYPNGVTCEYLATGASTDGRYGLYRWTFGEDESGPAAHFHRSITEQFYVLSGEVRLFDGRQWVTARPGDFLHVPEGGIHGFRGGDHASMLLGFAPGAPREDYFEGLARGLADDDAARAEFMVRHDTYWV